MIRSRSVDGYSRVRLDSSSSSSNSNNSNKNQFKVSASSIEQNLVSDQEKAIVRVARASQPSIAFITSVLVPTSHQDRFHSTGNGNNSSSTTTLPRNARPLGSGSAFVVDRRGYIVTNYHVIEMAYDLQQQQAYLQSLYRNVTSSLPSCPLFNNNSNSNNQPTLPVTAHIYVRIDSPTKYQKCRIVAVHPEVDLAIVQVMMMEDNIRSTPGSCSSFQSLQFGRSSQLLVGQTVVAIGNPFGYDTTVTTGVVSALNREIRLSDTSRRRRRRPMPTPNNHNNVVVRNCIQTDCAINPGNSGGPLLNLQGHVVGINTAIISTSGSNSGIGFAIASDMVQDLVQRDIQNDVVATQVWAGRRQRQRLPKRGTIGIQLLRTASTTTVVTTTKTPTTVEPNRRDSCCWIANVIPGSVADRAGLQGIRRTTTSTASSSSSSYYEDAIVAMNGQVVDGPGNAVSYLSSVLQGEQVTLTIYNAPRNETRMVYMTVP